MEELDVKFNEDMMKIDPNDRLREAKINALEVKRHEDLNAVKLIKMQETKSKKRKSIKEFDTRLKEANRNQKVRAIIDFDENDFNSIKTLAGEKHRRKSTQSIYERQNAHICKGVLNQFCL